MISYITIQLEFPLYATVPKLMICTVYYKPNKKNVEFTMNFDMGL